MIFALDSLSSDAAWASVAAAFLSFLAVVAVLRQTHLAKKQMSIAIDTLSKTQESLEISRQELVLISRQLRKANLSILPSVFNLREAPIGGRIPFGVRVLVNNNGRTVSPALVEIFVPVEDALSVKGLGNMKFGDGGAVVNGINCVRYYTLMTIPIFENHDNVVPDALWVLSSAAAITIYCRVTCEDGEFPLDGPKKFSVALTRVTITPTATGRVVSFDEPSK